MVLEASALNEYHIFIGSYQMIGAHRP